jgi:hypothetical protein
MTTRYSPGWACTFTPRAMVAPGPGRGRRGPPRTRGTGRRAGICHPMGGAVPTARLRAVAGHGPGRPQPPPRQAGRDQPHPGRRPRSPVGPARPSRRTSLEVAASPPDPIDPRRRFLRIFLLGVMARYSPAPTVATGPATTPALARHGKRRDRRQRSQMIDAPKTPAKDNNGLVVGAKAALVIDGGVTPRSASRSSDWPPASPTDRSPTWPTPPSTATTPSQSRLPRPGHRGLLAGEQGGHGRPGPREAAARGEHAH